VPQGGAQFAPNQERWREEVVSRVRQHRARRRRFDPSASLELDFQVEPPLTISSGPTAVQPQAEGETAEHPGDQRDPGENRVRKVVSFPGPLVVGRQTERAAEPKVVLEQDFGLLGIDTPRIREATEPEQIDLIPSFADIRLDAPDEEPSLAGEFDLPTQPAALVRRLGSCLLDAAIVLGALTVFALAVTMALSILTEVVPRSRPALLCGLATAAMLGLLFQYLFLVYGKRTPGMDVARLELLTFDGREPSPATCRWRALATTLSAVSLGLGFIWALVDEDTLGWHDRISGTYLRSGDRVIGSSGDLN
jgi:uncharacterized RDD family membrane protein YckC